MKQIQPGDQVVGLASDGIGIEVYTVAKVLPDGVQVEGTSGKVSKGSLRVYNEGTVEAIRNKEIGLHVLKEEILSLFESLDSVA